ncbi:MAG: hypothetical protein RQ833_03045 [Sphingomonadaceae bacterium]|nr:hypothetical protein [Sphingomonadaceae bacterium]
MQIIVQRFGTGNVKLGLPKLTGTVRLALTPDDMVRDLDGSGGRGDRSAQTGGLGPHRYVRRVVRRSGGA